MQFHGELPFKNPLEKSTSESVNLISESIISNDKDFFTVGDTSNDDSNHREEMCSQSCPAVYKL